MRSARRGRLMQKSAAGSPRNPRSRKCSSIARGSTAVVNAHLDRNPRLVRPQVPPGPGASPSTSTPSYSGPSHGLQGSKFPKGSKYQIKYLPAQHVAGESLSPADHKDVNSKQTSMRLSTVPYSCHQHLLQYLSRCSIMSLRHQLDKHTLHWLPPHGVLVALSCLLDIPA